MPIYSYKCDSCGKTFDKLLKANGNGNVKCIYCDSDSKRLFSPVGIIFKGSGFYVTDYKSGSNMPGKDNTNSQTKDKKVKEKKAESKDKSQKKKNLTTKDS